MAQKHMRVLEINLEIEELLSSVHRYGACATRAALLVREVRALVNLAVPVWILAQVSTSVQAIFFVAEEDQGKRMDWSGYYDLHQAYVVLEHEIGLRSIKERL